MPNSRQRLLGKVVIVTRADSQNESLSQALREEGAITVEVPLLAVTFQGNVDQVVVSMDKLQWVVVTSPNGARSVKEILPINLKVAVVGRATEEALGRSVDLVASSADARSLVVDFPECTDRSNGGVLVCRSNLADDMVIDGLAAKGWDVVSVQTYSVDFTDISQVRKLVQPLHDADAVVLASGSAVRSWARLGADRPQLAVVSIGPKTTAVARQLGLPVAVTAATQDVAGLVEAVVSAIG